MGRSHLFNVLWHVEGEGCGVNFEVGRRAMKLAMDLERQGYVVKVRKHPEGDPHAETEVYESDDWVPPGQVETEDNS